MQQAGFFWHVHHGRILLEWCYSYDERIEYIRTYKKPSHEQELRLRLFQPVKGQLPQEVVEVGNAYAETGKAYDEAGKAYGEAWNAFLEVAKAFLGARKAYFEAGYLEAGKAYFEARKAYDEAGKAYDEALFNHRDEIETLHAQECLDCPWDGRTIFSAA